MYLSNRDIKWAIECGKLIVDPRPEFFGGGFDLTSIDLHLSRIDLARVWDIEGYRAGVQGRGAHRHAEIELGSFEWNDIAAEYLVPIPTEPPDPEAPDAPTVYRRGNEVVVRPYGFLLWPTWERIGTPRIDAGKKEAQRHPELICFVNAKSTKARTGILVHFTAPTIHAGWVGTVTLEISNLGPFDFVLRERDVIAQLTVATISSAPDLELKKSKQHTQDQIDPSGTPKKPGPRRPKR